jgi:hypothetical protein
MLMVLAALQHRRKQLLRLLNYCIGTVLFVFVAVALDCGIIIILITIAVGLYI